MNPRSRTILFSALVLWSVGGCQSDGADEQDQLQALLRDDPLTQVLPGAAAATDPGASGAAGKTGRSDVILPTVNALGIWNFDDCTPSRTNLLDASFSNNTAFRSVGVTCTEGIENGKAVSIAVREDIVYVPDQPSFTFEGGVTVAGWFKPAALDGVKTLFRKRDKDTSSFALLLHAGKFELVVNLGNYHAISVIAPTRARLGVFQHVAGTFDGTAARLYVDGVEVARRAAAGTIPVGGGPLLMGNDGSERRFSGAIDSALFATHALTADEVLALTCFPHEPSFAVTPASQTTRFGVPTTFDVALTNHSSAACAPLTFGFQLAAFDGRFTFDPPEFTTVLSTPVPSGTTGHITVTATPKDEVDPGTTVFINFVVTEPVTGFFGTASVDLTVTGCRVATPRELMITDTSVVDDLLRTGFDPSSSDPRNGVWTFKHLVESMAPTPADAPAMVAAMLASFTTPQTVNGFVVPARAGMQRLVLDAWPRTADGALDLARAPLRLQAIVNRFDLRDLAAGDAGEGRFVFAFNNPRSPGLPLQATVIFEYKLPAATEQEVLGWAQSFHSLGLIPFGDSYNDALQAITERFVTRGARPGHPNGNAINAVRTNELDLGGNGLWQLREFHLSAASGLLEPAAMALTPDRSLNRSDTLASYIAANRDAIIAERHTVPEVFAGAPFQAGASINDAGTWFVEGVDPEARHHFALNTCNGCHSAAETRTSFLQIVPRRNGGEATLSGFLTGITVPDLVTRQPRTFNDLQRRNADLTAIVCGDPALRASAGRTTLRKGIERVH